MLKKRERLSRAEFEKTYTTGRRISVASATGIVAPSNEPKSAVVVSKKTAKNATARNVLRRRAYAVLGSIRPLWSGINIVVLLNTKASQLHYQELLKELTELIEKANRP